MSSAAAPPPLKSCPRAPPPPWDWPWPASRGPWSCSQRCRRGRRRGGARSRRRSRTCAGRGAGEQGLGLALSRTAPKASGEPARSRAQRTPLPEAADDNERPAPRRAHLHSKPSRPHFLLQAKQRPRFFCTGFSGAGSSSMGAGSATGAASAGAGTAAFSASASGCCCCCCCGGCCSGCGGCCCAGAGTGALRASLACCAAAAAFCCSAVCSLRRRAARRCGRHTSASRHGPAGKLGTGPAARPWLLGPGLPARAALRGVPPGPCARTPRHGQPQAPLTGSIWSRGPRRRGCLRQRQGRGASLVTPTVPKLPPAPPAPGPP